MELTPFSSVLSRLRGAVLCLQLRLVVLGCPALAWSFVLWFGVVFSLLWISKSKVSLILFKLLLNLDDILVGRAKRGDVQEFYFVMDVPVQAATIFEYQMLL